MSQQQHGTVSPTAHVTNPHLKSVLKTYAANAMHSLGGPGSFQEAWKSAGSAPSEAAAQHHHQQQRRPSSVASLRSPQPPSAVPSRAAAANFQILPPPIFSQPDQTSSELTDTLLEEVKIAGFVVGGETRLCLPQILNTVLSDKELSDINTVCDDLAIYMPQCSSLQLNRLKEAKVRFALV